MKDSRQIVVARPAGLDIVTGVGERARSDFEADGPATVQQLYQCARTAEIPLTEAVWRLTETDELKPKMRTTLRTLIEPWAAVISMPNW